MNLKTRIAILPLIAILGTLLLMWRVNYINHSLQKAVIYPEIRAGSIEEAKTMLKSDVEIMKKNIDKKIAGIKDRDEIIKIIKQETGHIRFFEDKSGYFFTYNTDGIRVHQPTDPSKDGQDFSGMKDAHGTYLIRELAEQAKQGGGFVKYYFEKVANGVSEGVQPKMSYSALLEGTDIFIGTGVYIDNVEKNIAALIGKVQKEEKEYNAQIIFAVILFVVVVGAMSVYLAISIIKPINEITHRLKSNAAHVASASEQMAQTSEILASGANEQAASIEEISSSLHEMSGITRKNADDTGEAERKAKDVNREAEEGFEAMKQMEVAIRDIKNSSDETAKILKTIDEIAFQTNLLALNAAVEAARAGEAGKGFAVVAEEVRNLAQRSAEAAKSTAGLITHSQTSADNGVKNVDQVLDSFQGIVKGVEDVSQIISSITMSSANQAQGIDQINEGVEQMNKATQANASSAEESTSSSEELSAQARELEGVVEALAKLAGLKAVS